MGFNMQNQQPDSGMQDGQQMYQNMGMMQQQVENNQP
jgi:hypothetical protein